MPYAVYERVRGEPLSALERAPEDGPRCGASWATISPCHTGVRADGPAGQLRAAGENPDPRPWIADFAREGYMTPDEARRLLAWLDRLAPQAQAPVPPRFGHGDVNAANILVDPAALTYLALIDWGGAGWGDAAWDFCPLALRAVPFVLAGYRAVAPLDNDPAAEARIAWHHVQLALYFHPARPRPSARPGRSAHPPVAGGARLVFGNALPALTAGWVGQISWHVRCSIGLHHRGGGCGRTNRWAPVVRVCPVGPPATLFALSRGGPSYGLSTTRRPHDRWDQTPERTAPRRGLSAGWRDRRV